MLYIISARIPGLGRDTNFVGCFDPTIVRLRRVDAFPEAIVCLEDAARSRIDVAKGIASRDGSAANRDTFLGVMENDARRRGPIWCLRLRPGTGQVIRGYCERYVVKFLSEEPFPEPLKARLVSFLEGLRLPSIEFDTLSAAIRKAVFSPVWGDIV